MTGNPQLHVGLENRAIGAQGQEKSELSQQLDSWSGWVTPGDLMAPKGSH